MTSPEAPLAGKTVQELQSLAAEAALADPQPVKRRLSRAARLHLIDQLSRWGGSGLALFAGIAIFITVVVARDTPTRAAVWAGLVFGALYLCRRYRKEFRRGDRIASRPFRWRAYYTSTIAVVSAAFGAGAFLLTPVGLEPAGALEIVALLLIGAMGAAALHVAHKPTAAAAGLPALIAATAASIAETGFGPFTVFVLAAGALAILSLALASAETERRASSRFPRTAFIRREVDRPAPQVPLPGARAVAG